MFKKFNAKENVSSTSLVKSSEQRKIRAALLSQMPNLENYIEDIWPKKEQISLAKCDNHVNMVVLNKEILFFQNRDGPFAPTLQLLHRYPDMLPQLQCDKGAIKYVISGANIMCPGLTSAGAKMPDDIPTNAVVAIMAEGKQHAVAVGVTKLSTQDIRSVNKGVAVESLHYLNDGLWTMHSRLD
mmetsp:Transcript_15134/g.25921  ORF Transcript_15134/g.25921 Transcript_15134/m.25921 type:complete len:184 (-) Transcript_15134:248-799(-)